MTNNIFGECKINLAWTNVTVHWKTYSNNFPFLSRIPFTTVRKNLHSFERLGYPFAQNTNSFEQLGHPFAQNTNLFERLYYPFAQNTNSFKRLHYPFAGNSNSFKRVGHPFAGNTVLLDQKHDCNNYSGIGRIFSFTFLHQLSGITFFVS